MAKGAVDTRDRGKGVWKLSGNQPSKLSGDDGGESRAGKLAAVVYGSAALIAALAFWAVTTFAGSYPAVARYGGAAWIFVLMMIVLMPIVIPRVRRSVQLQPLRGEGEPGDQP